MADTGNFFKVSRKGYDVDAVDAFVAAKAQEEAERSDLIAALEARVGQLNSQVDVLGEEAGRVSDLQTELEELRTVNAEQHTAIEELEQQVAGVREQEEALKLTLASATKTRDEMIAAAEAELATARELAKEESERILAEAKEKAGNLDSDIEELTSGARSQAETLVEEAKAEAAALVAEAKNKAGAIDGDLEQLITDAHTDAARLATEAQDEAETIIEAAKTAAAQLAAESASEAERITGEATAAAARREAELNDQVDQLNTEYADQIAQLDALRGTYETMAEQFRTILAGGLGALTDGSASLTTTLEHAPSPTVVSSTPAPSKPEPVETSAVEAAPVEAAADEPATAADDISRSAAGAESDTAIDAVADEAAIGEDTAPDPAETAEPVAAEPSHREATLEAPRVPSLADALKAAAAGQAADEAAEAELATVVSIESATNELDDDDLSEDAMVVEFDATASAAGDEAAVEFDSDENADAHEPSDEAAEAQAADDEDEDEDEHDDEDGDDATTTRSMLDRSSTDDTERGSFYSRRSGRLPRLGADASRSAMSAALGMRLGHDDD